MNEYIGILPSDMGKQTVLKCCLVVDYTGNALDSHVCDYHVLKNKHVACWLEQNLTYHTFSNSDSWNRSRPFSVQNRLCLVRIIGFQQKLNVFFPQRHIYREREREREQREQSRAEQSNESDGHTQRQTENERRTDRQTDRQTPHNCMCFVSQENKK